MKLLEHNKDCDSANVYTIKSMFEDHVFPKQVEGSFKETTRNGKHILRFVLLVLTPEVLLISEPRKEASSYLDSKNYSIPSLYGVASLKFTVFKKSQRQTLKICFGNEDYRYFELEKTCCKQIMWNMWCKQVVKLQRRDTNTSTDLAMSLDWNIVNQKWRPQNLVWNDKHLYLGSKREFEDQSRPSPVPGLGRTEDIKLLYLKPQYFGCWDQSEHWVQCESSKHFDNN